MVIWLGLSVTFTLGVSPPLLHSSLDERRSFLLKFLPRFLSLLSISSISTVLAGTILFGYVSSIDTAIMPVGWRFIFISIGAVLGLVGIILTLGVILPSGNKIINRNSSAEDASRNDVLRKYKYSNLDEDSLFSAISSTTRGLAVLLAIVMALMILGVSL